MKKNKNIMSVVLKMMFHFQTHLNMFIYPKKNKMGFKANHRTHLWGPSVKN